MPTYEYECNDCRKSFEIVQSMKDDALSNCPQCDSANFRRRISLPTIITKAKSTSVRHIIPNLIGDGGIDGTGRLDMPGRFIGVKRDTPEQSNDDE